MSSGRAQPSAVRTFADLTSDKARSIDKACDCFEHQLHTGAPPTIEGLLTGFQEPERSILLGELLLLEVEGCLWREMRPNREEYFRRFPEHASIVQEVMAELFPSAPQPPSPVQDAPPALANYRFLRKLSQGGMGAVYEAIHTELGNHVAIKVLRPDLSRDLEAEVRFQREMRNIGTLTHPYIVQARDAGAAGGALYLVMEYLVGFDLAQLVQRVGPLPVADACEIARRIALALQYAHQRNLVHRDLKPKNVLFGRSYGTDQPAQVKVADFGLALLRGYPRPHNQQAPGHVVGTVAFMAPEQFWEQTSSIRSDIYSLGCTLYYLLLRRPPFSRFKYHDTQRLMDAHRRAPVPPLRRLRPDVSELLERLILAMLAKRAQERPESPIDVAEQLGEFTSGCDLDRLLAAAEDSPGDFAAASQPGEPFSPIELVEHLSATKSWFAWRDRPPSASPSAAPGEAALAAEETPVLDRPSRAAEPAVAGQRVIPSWSRRAILLAAAPLAVALIWLAASSAWLFRRPQPVDLLAAVDHARDAISGDWQLRRGVLVSPDAPYARLALRHHVPAAYRLEIEARRESGGRLVVGLVRDGRQTPIILDSAVVGPVAPLDRSTAEASRQLAARLGFTGGPPNTYTCIVHPKGLLVAFRNEIRIAMGPNDAPPTTAHDWRTPGVDALFVGSHHSVYHFHRITLTPIQP